MSDEKAENLTQAEIDTLSRYYGITKAEAEGVTIGQWLWMKSEYNHIRSLELQGLSAQIKNRLYFIEGRLVFRGVVKPVEEIEESNLITHAKRELALIGEEPETVAGYLKVIEAWGDMGHSGGSASIGISVLFRLFQQKNLKPLTDNPDEWIIHRKGNFGAKRDYCQNKRNPEAFSDDGGKTYYLLSETKYWPWPIGTKHKIHKAVSHV